MTEENNNLTEKTIELNEKKAQGILNLARLEAQKAKAIGEERKLLEAKHQLQEAINAGNEEEIKTQAKIIATIEQTTKAQDELNKTVAAATALGKSYGDSIFGLDSKFLNAVKSAGGLTEAFKSYAAGMEEASKQSTVFEKFLDSTIIGFGNLGQTTLAAVKALDSAGAEFVQNTGASRDFAKAAFETRDSLGLMGISGAEAVGVMGDLYSNFSEFTELSEGSQQSFIELGAQIERLGGDAAGMGQTFTKVAGMSMPQTTAAITRLVGVADSLGIPFSQISDDVQAMGPLFAKFGTEAVDIFEGLQAASKATGLSVNELYGVVSQFDSFENAAQAAGRLHAALGVNIDSYTLLNANEEERILILQDLMAASGKTFEELSRYEKIELSNALGASLEETAQIFGTTSGEVRKTAAELMHASMTQEELAERTMDAATAADKLKVLMGNLAIAIGPAVETMNDFINALLKFGEKFGSTGSAFIVTAGLIAAATLKAALAGLFFGAKMKVAASIAGESGVKMAGATNSIGKAATRSAKGLLAFGAAMLMVGAGIGLAAWGMSTLVAAFGDLEGVEITGAAITIKQFAVAVGILGLTMATVGVYAIAGMFAMSRVMAVFGTSVILLAVGVSVLADSFTKMVAVFAKIDPGNIDAMGEGFLKLSLGTLAFSAAMTVLALNPFTGFGIRKLGKMFEKIREQIDLLNDKKVSSFATVLSSLAQLASMSLTDTGVPEYIAAIGKALDELPDNTEKTVAFKATADSLASLMQIASTVEAEQAARIETIIGAVSNSEGNERIEKVSNTLSSILSNVFDNKNSDGGSRKIVIELDGKKLGEYIDKRENAKARRYAQFT